MKGAIGGNDLFFDRDISREIGLGPGDAIRMNDEAHQVCRLSPVLLSDFTALRRIPSRPAAFRGENFDRDFDETTLFFDAFKTESGMIALLGPPFLNLTSDISRTRYFAGSKACEARVRHLDRHAQVWLHAPQNASALRAEGPAGNFTINVSPDDAAHFARRRVIFTMSKNNPIEWILDWVRFHRDIHGADAVLIYDNSSTEYDAATLSQALSSINGIAASMVVEWPFKYGPQGIDSKRYWDSDFCQLGAWEHARWRFLREARSVMNADIDELVLSQAGRTAFEMAETSPLGIVRYYGRWVMGIADRSPDPTSNQLRRHRDYDVVLREAKESARLLPHRDANRCPTKWTLAPKRCPAHAQWKVHAIGGWWPSRLSAGKLSFRHFREIASNWKYQRTTREAFDPLRHQDDEGLRAAYRRVAWDR